MTCSPSAHSSRASGAGTWGSSEQECAACGSARSTRSASEFLRNIGLTCFACGISGSSEQEISRLSMCSAVGSPVRTSASPAKEPASTERARVFGQSTPVSLANFVPDTCLWRTWQLSLLGGWESFSGTWPRSGMTRSGTAYQLQPLAPLTAATDFGLLPTPTETANHMAPSMRKHPGMRLLQDGLLPTPTVADASSGPGSSGRVGGRNLRTAVGGSLNPEFIEWMMGFPPGWTEVCHNRHHSPTERSRIESGDSRASETVSSRRSPSGLASESLSGGAMRTCEHCATPLVRRTFSTGRLEPSSNESRVDVCGARMAESHQEEA